MTTGLLDTLKARMDSFTPAARRIASHILTHRSDIPFENAASLAKRLDVSAMSVGRFCRSLGYRHFRELKDDLRLDGGSTPWLEGDALTRFRQRYGKEDELRRSLELEMASLVDVYQLVETREWRAAVTRIIRADLVQVAGFQTERGLAQLLANSLQYLRPSVELVDIANGHFGEIFTRPPAKRCLVLVDIKRYSLQTYLVAEEAAAARIPLIMITDRHCDWGKRFTPMVLMASGDSGQAWGSSVAMTCLINLLVNSVFAQAGPAVDKHLTQMSALFERFSGFVTPGTLRGRRK